MLAASVRVLSAVEPAGKNDGQVLVVVEFSSSNPGRLALSLGHADEGKKVIAESAFQGDNIAERLALPLSVDTEGRQSLTLSWVGTNEEVILRSLVVQTFTGKRISRLDPETLLPVDDAAPASEHRLVKDPIRQTIFRTFEVDLPAVVSPPPLPLIPPPPPTNWPLAIYLFAFLALGIVGAVGAASSWSTPSTDRVMRALGPLAWLMIFAGNFKLAGTMSITGVSLDDSWPLVLEYGAQRNWQLGSDLIYTFGPLGFLFDGRGLGGFAVERLIFAWAYAMFIAYVGWRVGGRLPWILRIPFWAFIILFPSTPTLLAAGVACVLMNGSKRTRADRLEWLGLMAGCAVVALVKFTDFLAISAMIFGFTTLLLMQRRWKFAIAVPTTFAGLHLVGWMLAGQSLFGFPSYLIGAWQISAGYGETMSYPPAPGMLGWGLALAAALLVCAAVNVAVSGRRWMETGLKSGIVLGCAFLSWKHGFVRADMGHVDFFMAMAFPYACLLTVAPGLEAFGTKPKTFSWRPALVVGAALVALFIAAAAAYQGAGRWMHPGWALKTAAQRIVASPSVKLPQLNEIPAEQRIEWQLPEITNLVRGAKVDIVNFQQNYAFLNGLNYQPRPVFQSYSSYTPYLHQVNLDYYRSASRPDWVLFQLESIDARHPWLDDAPLMLDLLTGWTPRLREKGFLLLEKPQPIAPQGTWRELQSGKTRWGRTIELPSRPPNTLIALKVDAPRSRSGKLKGFAYQPALGVLTLQMQDGRKVNRRFIPSLASTGVQLSPYLETIDDFLSWRANVGGKNEVVSFRLKAEADADGEYKRDYHYTLLEWVPPATRLETTSTVEGLLYPYFPGIPEVVRANGSLQVGLQEGLEACGGRAPNRFEFSVPAQVRGVTGRFAVVSAPGATPEEVSVGIHLVNKRGEKIAGYAQTLIPQKHDLDQQPHFFDVDFPPFSPDAKQRLIVEAASTKTRLAAHVWWGPVVWKNP
ncbi:hypothetical protein FEM03_04780 [Phragmitibacter flavus]|uniref:Uncharacterized protein n=1 Tax=Phragmitibacter flavus TaxID=2576071 RepID=A0A5R8KI94_9BACT|nr:hypothetical protein [Phragmitibacter flavus]TLD72043.1 hypothetical protein FEM03_04780 [Phragmitibacter flavus]